MEFWYPKDRAKTEHDCPLCEAGIPRTEMVNNKPIQSRRDQFWHEVNNKLIWRGCQPANNGEIEHVYRRTTCPRQAADFIEQHRAKLLLRKMFMNK